MKTAFIQNKNNVDTIKWIIDDLVEDEHIRLCRLLNMSYSMVVDDSVTVDMIVINGVVYDGENRIYPPPNINDRISNIVDKLNIIEDPTKLEINEYKQYLIDKSKMNLKLFLEYNPLEYNGGFYTMSEAKQTQLLATLNTYDAITRLNNDMIKLNETLPDEEKHQLLPNVLTWNERGKPCTEWVYEDLLKLFFIMFGMVKKIVIKQQYLEVSINDSDTREELDALDLTFSYNDFL
jgi:hypothetical protein